MSDVLDKLWARSELSGRVTGAYKVENLSLPPELKSYLRNSSFIIHNKWFWKLGIYIRLLGSWKFSRV
jgi:hypothetical protein